MLRKSSQELYAALTGEMSVSPDAISAGTLGDRLQSMARETTLDVAGLSDLGSSLFHAGRYEHARACYALAAQDPRALGAAVNLGRCDIRLGEWELAENRARELVKSRPFSVAAWHLFAEALEAGERYVEAATAMRQAVVLAPNQSVLHLQLGEICEEADDIESARDAYRQAYELDPRDTRALRLLLFAKRNLCDWDDIDRLSDALKMAIAAGDAFESVPFDVLAEGAGPALEQRCARMQAARMLEKAAREPLSGNFVHHDGPPRIGFVSNGLGLHPTTVLTSEIFALLAGTGLEVHLFSTRNDEGHAQRRRLAEAVHGFHHLHGWKPRAIAEYIRRLGVEILIDLDGYLRARMPEVFAFRGAPIQVSWMGYPGTLGAAYMDYVIADRIVLPPPLQSYFDEKTVYLPRCFQSSDTTRMIGEPPPREACGLPEAPTVVYVCFNASFKLNPRSFDRMMHILARVPGSTLWLLQGPGQADARIRQAAQRAGIDPSRIVFMKKQAHLVYLSMYKHADLFLDNEHYNAHTTASDALWAGCPVLTRSGETFATRVAASLNHHLGMAEMNVESDAEFVERAVQYGLDANLRLQIREKLALQRTHSGLFDMKGFATDFAALLRRMSIHYRAGHASKSFADET
jgi:predicted O-linked N-acetylglucosamine transferase (SPINDLY family)